MAKPTSLPEWAIDGSALIIEPNAAKKDVGWLRGEPPPAEYENWRAKLVYDWTAYLDSGALEGNHSVDGDLTVTGDIGHGERTLIVGASLMIGDSADWAFATGAVDPVWVHNSAGSDNVVAAIPLATGDRITAVSAWCKLGASATDGLQMRLYKVPLDTGTSVNQSDLVATADSTTRQEVVFTGITPEVITADTQWVVVFTSNANVLLSVYALQVTYDRP